MLYHLLLKYKQVKFTRIIHANKINLLNIVKQWLLDLKIKSGKSYKKNIGKLSSFVMIKYDFLDWNRWIDYTFTNSRFFM